MEQFVVYAFIFHVPDHINCWSAEVLVWTERKSVSPRMNLRVVINLNDKYVCSTIKPFDGRNIVAF